MDAAILVEGLTKDFGGKRALADLDLKVQQGEIFGFLGPNGAGKTTTIRLLLDLIRPTSGRATIAGRDCQRESQEVRSLVGYLPGDLRLYPRLTGHDMVDLIAGLRTQSVDRQYIRHLGEQFDLDLHGHIGTYSKGMRQKLGLLLALLARPPVLVLDEPTSGLDPWVQHIVWEVLLQEASSGTTVFFSSHVLHEVQHVCSRVGLLRAGHLIAVEPVVDLLERTTRRLEVTFSEDVPEGVFRLPNVREVEREDHTVRFDLTGDADDLVKELAQFHVTDLRSEQLDLDDVLLPYFGTEPAA